MKKIYLALGCALSILPAMAQDAQITNGDFEKPFTECIPWTSDDNTKAEGTTPFGWTISQVIGIKGTGATTVGEKAEGYKSPQAVKVYNTPNKFMPTQIVPGYVTLGTTWSTSVMGKDNDGGTFGGIDFTGRPSKITFMYKRELGAEGNKQPATVVAYLWKGTFTQADVPANIVIVGSPASVNMVNRDRSILGIDTAKGGEVTKSDDAELIASATLSITEATSDWTEGSIEFEYFSEATPEHFNIIFAANDYFGDAADIEAGNSLTIDNVYCIYGGTEEPVEPVVPAGPGVDYVGKLVVSLAGSEITSEGGDDATVTITPNTDGSCTFLLPNLSLGDLGTLGDIKLDRVETSTADGKTTYTASVKDFTLMDGAIVADVDLTGSTTETGDADMTINVTWQGMPIVCSFKGKNEAAGIGAIDSDNAALPVQYFDLQGRRVADPSAPGLYIRRQGTEAVKVLVR